MYLSDKSILVTGASGGIGAAILRELTKSKVLAFAHYFNNEGEIERIKSEATSPITSLKANFADRDEIKGMFEKIKEEVDSIDILINVVGIEDSTQDPLDTEGWQKVWDVNLFGVIETCREALKIMNEGVIVNISSIMGKHDVAVPIELTSYAVAKAALNKFTLNLAYNYAPKLRAVTVSPGYTLTKMWDGFDTKMKDECIEDTPIKRFIEPQEVAKAVRAVIENNAITGQDIVVDGGLGTRLIQ